MFSKYVDSYLCVTRLIFLHRRGDTFIYGDSDEVFFLAIGEVKPIVKSVFNPFLMKRWYGM